MTVVCNLMSSITYFLADLILIIEQQALSENKDLCDDDQSMFNNIALGARQTSQTVGDILEAQAAEGEICHQFRDKLHKFLLAELRGEVPEDNLAVHLSTKVENLRILV